MLGGQPTAIVRAMFGRAASGLFASFGGLGGFFGGLLCHELEIFWQVVLVDWVGFAKFGKKNMTKETFKAEKISIRKLLENFFEIPSFQRGYVWETDHASELLEDTYFAFENKKDSEYFLGSLVLQKSFRTGDDDIKYEEYLVLDGQQRLTTLLMMIAAFKNKFEEEDYKNECSELLYRKQNRAKKIPEKTRLTFKIRDKVQEYVKSKFIMGDDSVITPKNNSAINLTNVFDFFSSELDKLDEAKVQMFFGFIMDNVQVVYVATEKFEDAFRLFTILNNRGVPLTPSDILKSENLGLIEDEVEQDRKAREWENIESALGKEDFEKLISYIRTIILKEKAREDILTEFREKIFKTRLIKQGKDFIDLTSKYAEIYKKITANVIAESGFSPKMSSLLDVFNRTFPSSDWVPSLILYISKFNHNRIEEFTNILLAKNASDFIVGKSPTERITNNLTILKEVGKVSPQKLSELLIENEAFECDLATLRNLFERDVYHSRHSKLVMLLNEYLLSIEHSDYIAISYPNTLSIEHICPQNILTDPSWQTSFNNEEHLSHLHTIGNLIVISRRKNSALSNRPFSEKKSRYFSGSISNFPDANLIMLETEWTPSTIQKRTKEIMSRLMKFFHQSSQTPTS